MPASAALEIQSLRPFSRKPPSQRSAVVLSEKASLPEPASESAYEPTVSLDADAAALVADLVREHIAAGGMALIATHVELGLGDIPTLEMTPPEVDAHHQDDPFLAGAWT